VTSQFKFHCHSTVQLLLHFNKHVNVWHYEKSSNIPVTWFAWYTSCVAISFVVIPYMVILCVPFYTCCSMTISYTSGYYAYLASSYVQARYTQLESGINLQNLVHNCEWSTCRECVS